MAAYVATQDDVKLDQLSELTLLTQLLKGTMSKERRLVIQLLWDMINKKGMKDQEIEDVRLLLRKLDIVCEMRPRLQRACNCTFLLGRRELVPLFFGEVFKRPEEAHKLHYLVAAVRDPVQVR